MKALMISGSRNLSGQTARAAEAVLDGLRSQGGDADSVFLTTIALERCRQCDENGWGLCRSEGRCVIEDDFAALVDRVRTTDVLVFANPVYFADLSESLRAFLDRLRRVTRHEQGRTIVEGTPAIGVCVAGGGGGGAPASCVSLEKVLSTCGFDVVDMIPVRRQNLDVKCAQLRLVGEWLAGNPTSD